MVLPVAAGGLYLEFGTPELPGLPFAERVQPNAAAKGPTTAEITAMVAKIERRLAEEPGKLEGWIILTTAYLRLGREAEAEAALDRALGLTAGDKPRAASIAVNYAEAVVAMNNGQVVPRALAAFTRALGLVPGLPAAGYYLGLEQLQAGDRAGALATWRKLVASAPKDAPWLPGLEKRIERITAGRGMETEGRPSAPTR